MIRSIFFKTEASAQKFLIFSLLFPPYALSLLPSRHRLAVGAAFALLFVVGGMIYISSLENGLYQYLMYSGCYSFIAFYPMRKRFNPMLIIAYKVIFLTVYLLSLWLTLSGVVFMKIAVVVLLGLIAIRLIWLDGRSG